MSIVEVKDLRKRYGKTIALNGVSLSIEEGMIYGLIGPNGSGKSTMINILSGLIGFNNGECKVFQLDITKERKAIQEAIGVVPQEYSIYNDLRAKENVAFFGKLYGLKKSIINSRVDEALSFVGLMEYKDSFPDTFSGGMKRRLNIACSLVHRPKLLIMDEPTASLDPISRDIILETVKKLNNKGCTIIYTSHYLDEIELLCHRAIILNKGNVIVEGTPNKIKNMIPTRNKIRLTLCKSNLSVEKDLERVIELKTSNTVNGFLKCSEVNISYGNSGIMKDIEIECDNPTVILEILLPYLRRINVIIKDIEVTKGSLDDVFIKIIQ